MIEGSLAFGVWLLGTVNLLTRAVFRCPWVLADSYTHFYVAEEMRRTRSMRPRLEKYLFDAAVPNTFDYPPLFGVLLALVDGSASASRRERLARWLPSLVDTAALCTASLCAVWLSGSGLAGLLVALVWVMAPCTHAQTLAVSGRPLGALVATVLFSALAKCVALWSWPTVGLALAFGAALYLVNKLAVQAWCLLTATFCVTSQSLWPFGIQVGSLLLATIITRGLAWDVHLGHWRHLVRLRMLMAKKGWHQLARFSGRRHAAPRPRGAKLLLRVLTFLDLPYVWLLPLGAMVVGIDDLQSEPFAVCLVWLGTLLVSGALIQGVPGLRFIGEGFRYFEFGIVPLAVLLSAFLQRAQVGGLLVLALAGAALAVLSTWQIRRTTRASFSDASCRDGRAVRLARRLRDRPVDRFLVLPLGYAPLLTVEGHKKTLMMLGGVASEAAEGFYPVMERPPSEFVRQYALEGVFLDRRYAEPEELGLGPLILVDQDGPFGAYAMPPLRPAGELAG